MPNLLRWGNFISHSGKKLEYKIDCDALTDADWLTIADIITLSLGIRFCGVVGIEHGGKKLEYALKTHIDPTAEHYLIVDDVLTTGESMESARAFLKRPCKGFVVFARGPCPPWITPLFTCHHKNETPKKD